MECVPSVRLPLSANSAHSSPRPASPLPFLRLPGEIRNMIYEYVFSERICPIQYWNGTIKMRWLQAVHNRYNGPFDVFTALTRTCRQIYKETRLMPFKYCEYHISFHYTIEYVYCMDRADQELRDVVWARFTEAERELVKAKENRMRAEPDRWFLD